MRRSLNNSFRNEQGLVITLVAVFMASVVIVMAALAIDLTTLYTARSEAQLAADGAALAAARVLANSGLTSSDGNIPLSTAFDTAGTENLATAVAMQVAASDPIGGKNLVPPGGASPTCGPGLSISVCFRDTDVSNPRVTVQVTRTDLPTFFLRFWSKQLTASASATAEAYNPAGLSTRRDPAAPVAPVCVKPWLLPNLDPTQTTGNPIFDRRHGTIENANLIGQQWPNLAPVSPTNPSPNTDGLFSQPYTSAPVAGRYYGGEISGTNFNVPTTSLPACSSTLTTDYQTAIAACVPNPIPCGRNADINVHTAGYPARDLDTVTAVECLIHYNGNIQDTDSLVGETTPPALPPASITPPFEFLAGKQNPITSTRNQDVMVSDSLVTVPVYDQTAGGPPGSQTVNVIGFLQVFLNPQSGLLPYAGPNSANEIPATIINQIGCGTDSNGTPIYGNGPSAVPVRLITPP